MVGPRQTWATLPSGSRKRFSGELDGPVTSHLLFRLLDQVVEVEERRLLQDRIGPAQELAVEREGVVLPEVLAEPRRAADGRAPGRIFAGRGEAPGVGDDVRHPAARVVVGLRGLAARLDQRGDELVQRLVQLGEVADLGRPVVHLDVDVEMPVAVPRRLDFLGPDALQVGRQSAGPRGADQQVAAEVEIQRRQRGIGPRPAANPASRSVGRQRAVGGRGQVQLHAVEPFLVIRLLCRAEFVERFLRRLVEIALRRGDRIVQLPAGKALEIRRGGQQQHDLIGASRRRARLRSAFTEPPRASTRSRAA